MLVVHLGRFSQSVAPLRYRRFYEQRTRDSLFECSLSEACSPIFTGLPTKEPLFVIPHPLGFGIGPQYEAVAHFLQSLGQRF